MAPRAALATRAGDAPTLPATTGGPRPRLVAADAMARLQRAYAAGLPRPAGTEPHLAGVLDDALAHPGSLARAQLAWAVMRDAGVPESRSLALAVAVEYFHTASLLFDDLPAMDDAADRRGRPCPHRVWGEGAAILGALGFVTRGYALLWRAFSDLAPAARERASRLVETCLGVAGILDGQSRDLHFGGSGGGADVVARIAEGKTVSLIRLALVLPAVVAGADEGAQERLDRLARAWGLAYQLLDDAKDALMSREETGKTPLRDRVLGRPNLPAAVGWSRAMARLRRHLADGRREIEALGGAPEGALASLQAFLEAEAAEVRARLGGVAATGG